MPKHAINLLSPGIEFALNELISMFGPGTERTTTMEELLRTNNMVTISFAESLLSELGIVHFVADQHMSIVDGSLGILPRRIMVDGEKIIEARKLMQDAGLGAELPSKPVRPIAGSSD